jgi:hypothetical protein
MNKKIKSKAGKKTTKREVKKAIKNPGTISKMPTKKVVGLKIETKYHLPGSSKKALEEARGQGYKAMDKSFTKNENAPLYKSVGDGLSSYRKAASKEAGKRGYTFKWTSKKDPNSKKYTSKQSLIMKPIKTTTKVTGVKTKTVGGFIRVTNEENGGRYGFTKKKK